MFSIKKIKISLLDKNGEPQYGLNWGQRPGREPNQAYIQLPIEVYRSDFFPKKPQRFKIYADGNEEFVFTRAQKTEEGSALQTTDNSLLGKYLRTRLGVAPGQKITLEDILRYGCTEITFFKISSDADILYYMDFSKGDPLPLSIVDDDEKNINQFPHNRIIFGAPGTGKSHQLNEDAKYFLNQENNNDSDKNGILNKISAAFANKNFLQILNTIGFSYSAGIKTLLNGDTSKKNIAETFFKDKLEHTKKHSADAFYFPLITKKEDFKYSGNGDFKSFFESKIQEFQKNQVGQEIGKTPLFNALGYYNSEEILALLGFSEEEDIGNYNVVQTRYKLTTTEAQWLWRGVSAAQIELEQIKMDYVERVTFHPNYSYAHFVGTYKPVQDKDDPKQIRYEYVPGPFMRTLTKALNNPGSNFLLIIEEINRANVAAVFGDVFQMLDRDKNGTSEYPIAASKDIKKYLKDEIKTGNIDLEQIRIPSNMYIWATMNSADQGVFPMDAAFKRRWNFEYLGIDDKENKVQNYYIPMGKDRNVNWNDFRKKLNNKLSEHGTNEDKLLGPFFLSSKDLENALKDREAFIKLFKSKVLMYLFEDVVKMNPGKLFTGIGNNPMRYSEICKAFDEQGEKIFGFSLGQNNDGNPS